MCRLMVLLLAVLVASPAHAINKCTDPNGKVTYSDLPCHASAKVTTIAPAHEVTEEEVFEAQQRARSDSYSLRKIESEYEAQAAAQRHAVRKREAAEARQAKEEAEAAQRQQDNQDLADRIAAANNAYRPIYPSRPYSPPHRPPPPAPRPPSRALMQ